MGVSMLKIQKGLRQMALNEWDRRYLRIARQVSRWSKDPSTKVGAVMADNQGRVVALGYNGFPRNIEDAEAKLVIRELKYEMVVHAEVNAVLIAGRSTAGGTIYVHGAPICPRCASVLIQSGITRAVGTPPQAGTCVKWDKDGLIALDMFKEAKITFDPVGNADQVSD
jgi:dCMP deaminase